MKITRTRGNADCGRGTKSQLSLWLGILALAVMATTVCGCSYINKFKQGLYTDYAAQPFKYEANNGPLQKIVEEVKCARIGGVEVKNSDGCPTSGGRRVVEDDCLVVSATAPADPAACRWGRDLIAADMVEASNALCTKHIKTIFGNEATFNIFTGTLTNAFSGAATVVSGEMTKSVLSAVAFFSNAERSLVNETVYKSVLVTAVTKKIREIRQTKFDNIRKNLLEKDVAAYSVTAAIADVLDYHKSCSFMLGLQVALDEGTQDRTAAKRGTLRRTLALIGLEFDEVKREVPAPNRAADTRYLAIEGRYQAVSDALKALEVKDTATD